MLDERLQVKYSRMQSLLRELESVVVAFSGGVDSAVVLKVAVDVLGRERVLAVTSRSSSVAQSELDDARRVVQWVGVAHELIETKEFADENYLANPTNRCYYCKTALYDQMQSYLRRGRYRTLVNGTNADDLGDWRPGLLAASERAVRAPLAESGMTKAEVRQLAAALNLSLHDKPASPCLSSRVQYGERITPAKLSRIEQAEQVLRAYGFRECRVRHHDQLARIEVAAGEVGRLLQPELRQTIDAALRELGYQYVTVDLRGFRSGSMNESVALTISSTSRT
ncbi:MAG: Pyridinium-3,5-biscarboxylic acid mononucleotide sulfurtransferase [Phycisphaerae bacterium]|nr:Pyridinium-3,5-biscarboxylic acid mononucleotide sulfurtransferase [Phycisphaerae bacterium]